MFKFLEFFSIKLKFFMLLTIPMSALCIFSAISLFELFSQKNNLVLLKKPHIKSRKNERRNSRTSKRKRDVVWISDGSKRNQKTEYYFSD